MVGLLLCLLSVRLQVRWYCLGSLSRDRKIDRRHQPKHREAGRRAWSGLVKDQRLLTAVQDISYFSIGMDLFLI